MVWEWAGHTVGRTFGLVLSLSHCGKNTWFGIGPVTLWEQHSVWDWTGHIVGRTLGFGLGQSQKHSVWDWAGHIVGRTQAEGV